MKSDERAATEKGKKNKTRKSSSAKKYSYYVL